MRNETVFAQPYTSLTTLRTAHNELVVRRREEGDSPALLEDAVALVQRGAAVGALLDAEDDRQAAQSLLDYWDNLLFRAGHAVPDPTLADFDPALAPELPAEACPYVGLDIFREQNTQLFFGRQGLVKTLVDLLRNRRLLAVIGPSGGGKSSLVLAGLAPALKQGVIAAEQGNDSSDQWRYPPRMVPGSDPLANLARLLQSAGQEAQRPDGATIQTWTAQQVQRLRTDPTTLAQLLASTGDKPALLVVDQFEEIFTLCSDEVERTAFIANLLYLVQTPALRHRVILTMRSDFETQVARLPALEPLFQAGIVRVTPLNAAELRQAIQEPADLVGLKFEDGIVDALLGDILGEPAALPLLQFTLLKLWENRERNRITWQAYNRLGGGRQALARSADAFYQNLGLLQNQNTARHILLRMVRLNQLLEPTSNRVRRSSLYQAEIARERIDDILDRLIKAHLVKVSEGDITADAQVEVAHETLVRNWPLLIDWLADERQAILRRQRLTEAAEQWLALGRDPGALLRGALLREFQEYSDLNELEAEFVQASLKRIDDEQRKELDRRVRLTNAQAVAREQAVAAARLRRRNGWLISTSIITVFAMIIAVLFGVLALQNSISAREQSSFALTAEAKAIAEQLKSQQALDTLEQVLEAQGIAPETTSGQPPQSVSILTPNPSGVDSLLLPTTSPTPMPNHRATLVAADEFLRQQRATEAAITATATAATAVAVQQTIAVGATASATSLQAAETAATAAATATATAAQATREAEAQQPPPPTPTPQFTGAYYIVKPVNGAILDCVADIIGVATGDDFLRWQLNLILDPQSEQKPDGEQQPPPPYLAGGSQKIETPALLTQLYSPSYPAGVHKLRLRVIKQDSNYEADYFTTVTFNKTSAQCPIVNDIKTPLEGATVSGQVTVEGVAFDVEFQEWQLAVRPNQSGEDQNFYVNRSNTPQFGGALGVFDTAGRPDGPYDIALRVVKKNGTFDEYVRTVFVKNQ